MEEHVASIFMVEDEGNTYHKNVPEYLPDYLCHILDSPVLSRQDTTLKNRVSGRDNTLHTN